jgi:hypothetical protein
MPKPSIIWNSWITNIALDKQMDLDRTLRHLQVHVSNHMPNSDAPKERWSQWLAGTYNLLGIISTMTGSSPSFELGIGRLFQKFRQHPMDHTPPPKGTIEIVRSMPK